MIPNFSLLIIGESKTPNCENHPALESDTRPEEAGKENREQVRRLTLRERSRAERRSIPIINGIVPLEEVAPATLEEEPAEKVEKTLIVQVCILPDLSMEVAR